MLLLLDLAEIAPVPHHFGDCFSSINLGGGLLSATCFSQLRHDVAPLFENVLGESGRAYSGLHLASESVVVPCVKVQEGLLEL